MRSYFKDYNLTVTGPGGARGATHAGALPPPPFPRPRGPHSNA